MKTIGFTTMVAGLLLVCSSIIQAQTTPIKLNQVELMKQFLGNWKAEFGKDKDTVALLENKSLYNGFDFHYQLKTKDKVLFEERTFTGYDEKNNRLIKVFFSDSIPEFGILTLWFTTATRCEEIFLEDISNPDKAKLKWIFEFKTPDLLIWTFIKNNEVVYVDTYNRVKQ
jgi:hypothetical protein